MLENIIVWIFWEVFHVKVQKFTIWSILAIFSYFSLIFIIRKMPRAELGFEKEGGFLVNVISRHLIPVKKSVLILAHLVFCLFKPIKPPPILSTSISESLISFRL